MKQIMFAVLVVVWLALPTVAMAGKRKEKPHLDTTQPVAWHVRVEHLTRGGDIVRLGDTPCHVGDNWATCSPGVTVSVFLMPDGRLYDAPFSFFMDADNLGQKCNVEILRLTNFAFNFTAESITEPDVLGKPVTKILLSATYPSCKPELRCKLEWRQATHDIEMMAIAQTIVECDRWHQEYRTPCTDEDTTVILKEWVAKTPALSIVDPKFLAKVPELVQLQHYLQAK
jgi:hypothetical protein